MRQARSHRPVARPAVPGLATRRAAVAVLDAILSTGGMLDEMRTTGSGAERAEARGLADLTLRRLGQVDDALRRLVDRPPAGRGRQILRLMAAELMFARTAPHAAVDLAVRLAQEDRKTARLSGLVNAVGRRLASCHAELTAEQDAVALCMPVWLSRALARDWGDVVAAAIAAAHLVPAPHDLTAKVPADAASVARRLEGRVLPTGSIRLGGRPQITALPGYAEGEWWVQDAAAALPARLIPSPAGKRVLDLCAAPGGKTLQLAAAGAHVTALDRAPQRLARLEANLERTELSAATVAADALEWEPEAPFDAILLDAPCTATGTIRRHPDLPHRLDVSALPELTRLQARLLDRAFGWLAPGGALVYCTCSLLKAEGEALVDAFVDRTPDAAPDPVVPGESLPAEFADGRGRLRTRPDRWAADGGLDGFFAARIVRR